MTRLLTAKVNTFDKESIFLEFSGLPTTTPQREECFQINTTKFWRTGITPVGTGDAAYCAPKKYE